MPSAASSRLLPTRSRPRRSPASSTAVAATTSRGRMRDRGCSGSPPTCCGDTGGRRSDVSTPTRAAPVGWSRGLSEPVAADLAAALRALPRCEREPLLLFAWAEPRLRGDRDCRRWRWPAPESPRHSSASARTATATPPQPRSATSGCRRTDAPGAASCSGGRVLVHEVDPGVHRQRARAGLVGARPTCPGDLAGTERRAAAGAQRQAGVPHRGRPQTLDCSGQASGRASDVVDAALAFPEPEPSIRSERALRGVPPAGRRERQRHRR